MKRSPIRRCVTGLLAVCMSVAQACPVSIDAVMAELNALRARGGVCGARGAFPAAGPVQWNTTLEAMARQHARFLVGVGELRHRNEAGQALAERATAAGYRFRRIGENLAQGQPTLTSVLHAWTVSDTHCATQLGAAYTDVALACEPGKNGRPLWVMVLARPQP